MMTPEMSKVKEFYTVTIPSANCSLYTEPMSIKVIDMSPKDPLYHFNLKQTSSDTHLPPCLNGVIPTQQDLPEEEDRWVRFKLFYSTAKKTQTHYDIKKCASPGCSREIPDSERSTHLNLCKDHHEQLQALLQRYRTSYGITVPDLDDEEVHRMLYYSLLPSIDHLIRELSTSPNNHYKYVTQLLCALKTCIYLYRMHLNQFTNFIMTATGLFQWLLNLNRTAMATFAKKILNLVVIPFAIFGIGIVWSASLIFHERHLGIALIYGGVALGAYGYISHHMNPIAFGKSIAFAIGGATSSSIGMCILYDSVKSHVDNRNMINVQVMLSDVHNYFRQFILS
ncbi:unnamed protein product [Rotaria socialis]|uniref:Uncharacterized protein n=1 Tax=Rotaria socialis TaxID=392032 RepID=A0A818GTB0_9BILA|nr:unnamed protein product [Rotaria socialis]CAF4758780.1 unnamed protein product [Rotaria socialis]